MKLKFKNIFLISFLAIASVFGAFSAVIATEKANDTPLMEKAEAAWAYTAGDVVYFDDSNDGNWSSASSVGLYVTDDSNSQWVVGTKLSSPKGASGKVYKFILPALNWSPTKYIFAKNASWSGIQTQDFATQYMEGKNYFRIQGGSGTGYYCYWEYKAPELSNGFYIYGSFCNWVNANAKPLTDNTSQTANEYYYKGMIFESGTTTFQMISVSSGVVTWYNCASVTKYGNTASSNYINAYDAGDNAGVWVTDGQYRIFDLYINSSSKNYHFAQSTLTCTIGSVSANSDFNGDNEDELKFELSGVVAGTTISSIKTSQNYEISFTHSDTSGTNINSDNSVVIGGSVNVYINRWTWNVTWVSGYSDHAAPDFASGFLVDTISGSTCPNPSSTVKEDTTVWTWYSNWYADLSSDQKVAFQYYVNNISIHGTYKNSYEEAAARYVVLKQKYPSLPSFDGLSISRSMANLTLFNMFESDNNITTIIIVVASSVALLSVTALSILVIKKRKNKEQE